MSCPGCGGSKGDTSVKKNDCGCEGARGRSGKQKSSEAKHRGGDSFEKWKQEVLTQGCSDDSGGKKLGFKDDDCGEFCRRMHRKKKEPAKPGCTCCTFMLCAAVLLAAGVTVALIKKKLID